MKIGLVSSFTPHIKGGARFIVDWLEPRLVEAGHKVERILIPTAPGASDYLLDMTAFRMLDLAHSCDRIITFSPPAHALKHPSKLVWFIHHERVFYDLWESEYCPFPRDGYWSSYRIAVQAADRRSLLEAKSVFCNSKVVQRRLRDFNNIDAEVLYPPIGEPGGFVNRGFGNTVVAVCRIEHHKRQHLIVEAMAHVRTDVKLYIAGVSADRRYLEHLLELVDRFGLHDRVKIDPRWISESEKQEHLSTALAAVYLPVDEDSYGYPTLEAAHSSKATVTMSDSGGTLEFVQDGSTGLIVPPDCRALAEAFDRLQLDRAEAVHLGRRARERINELDIGWSHVIGRLTA